MVLPSIAVTVDATRNVYLLLRICCVLTSYLNTISIFLILDPVASHYLVSPCFTGGTATTAPATALDAAASCALCAFGRCGWRCPLPPQMADRCYHATRLWGHTLAQKYLIELLMWSASVVHKQSPKI